MAVMVPRETVTEHRLDALEKKVDEGFAKVAERFEQVDERFNRLEARTDNGFAQLNDRFDRLQLALFRGAVAVIVTLIGSTATLAGVAFF